MDIQKLMQLGHQASGVIHLSQLVWRKIQTEYTLLKHRPMLAIFFKKIKFWREPETSIKSISSDLSGSALHAFDRWNIHK